MEKMVEVKMEDFLATEFNNEFNYDVDPIEELKLNDLHFRVDTIDMDVVISILESRENNTNYLIRRALKDRFPVLKDKEAMRLFNNRLEDYAFLMSQRLKLLGGYLYTPNPAVKEKRCKNEEKE